MQFIKFLIFFIFLIQMSYSAEHYQRQKNKKDLKIKYLNSIQLAIIKKAVNQIIENTNS